MSSQQVEQDEKAYDQYGFLVPVSVIEQQKDKKFLKKLNARVEKWRRMLPQIENLISSSNKKLKSRVRKGIPDGIRAKVWPVLGKIDALKEKYKNQPYKQLVDSADYPYENDIAADLSRTFPKHEIFSHDNQVGINSLNNILKAVSLTHADMGYCQGINFVAASFMIQMNDEEAYYMILSILENYDCKKMYFDVSSIRRQLFVHDHLVKKFLPDISKILEEQSIDSIGYATGWYMTLFSNALPFKYFLRIMDIFLLEKWKIIYRVSLTMLKLKKKRILAAKNFDQIYKILKDFSEYEYNRIDEDMFFNMACNDFIFSKKLLVQLEKQFDATSQPIKKVVPNRPLAQKVLDNQLKQNQESNEINMLSHKVEPSEQQNIESKEKIALQQVQLEEIHIQPIKLDQLPIQPKQLDEHPMQPVQLDQQPIQPVQLGEHPIQPVQLNEHPIQPVHPDTLQQIGNDMIIIQQTEVKELFVDAEQAELAECYENNSQTHHIIWNCDISSDQCDEKKNQIKIPL